MSEHPNCQDDTCPVCLVEQAVSPDGFDTDTASCLVCKAQWEIEWDFSDGGAGWIAGKRLAGYTDAVSMLHRLIGWGAQHMPSTLNTDKTWNEAKALARALREDDE